MLISYSRWKYNDDTVFVLDHIFTYNGTVVRKIICIIYYRFRHLGDLFAVRRSIAQDSRDVPHVINIRCNC